MIRLLHNITIICILFSASAFASVPHDVDKYAFHIDLPDGFTKVVTEEVPSQRVYDSYHGNHKDKSFVRVHIQKEDVEGDWSEEQLRHQLQQTVSVYKERGAKILKAEMIHLQNHNALLIHSCHDGKEHLALQMYVDGTMYVVASTFDEKDKYGLKDFLPMVQSVQCK